MSSTTVSRLPVLQLGYSTVALTCCAVSCLKVPHSKRRFVVLAGCVLILMPCSVSNYYGNLLIYLSSYYYTNAARIKIWVDPLWPNSVFKVTQPLGMVISGYVERRTNIRLGIAIASFLECSSIFLSYFSIVEPLGLIVTFGFIQGIGGGFMVGLLFKLAAECLPERKGVAFASLFFGQSLYPLLHTLLAFYMINPENKAADAIEGNINYFTDPEIVGRVPSFFLKIGVLTLFLEVCGLILIHWPAREENPVVTEVTEIDESVVLPSRVSAKEETSVCPQKDANYLDEGREEESLLYGDKSDYGSSRNGVTAYNLETEISESTMITDAKSLSLHISNDINETSSPELTSNCRSEPSTHNDISTLKKNHIETKSEISPTNDDLTPKEVVTSSIFWRAWATFVLMGHTTYLQLNLYKQFGLTVINDDSVLSLTASLCTVSMIVFRLLSGVLVDKLGLKLVLVMICAACNVLQTLMPVTLYTFYPLYLVVSVLGFGATSCVAVYYYLVPLTIFGPTYYPTNVAMISSSFMLVFFCDPLLAPYLINSIGWTYVFFTGTVTSALGFFLCLTLPAPNRK